MLHTAQDLTWFCVMILVWYAVVGLPCSGVLDGWKKKKKNVMRYATQKPLARQSGIFSFFFLFLFLLIGPWGERKERNKEGDSLRVYFSLSTLLRWRGK